MLIKHFRDADLFYKFLKERLRVHVKEARLRAGEGVFHCVYESAPSVSPKSLFEAGRRACVSVFWSEGKFVVCGSEARLKDFCSELVRYEDAKKLAREILEALINYRKKNFRLQYNRKILPLGLKTAIMGVINLTPDSFSDGGLYNEPTKALKRALRMAQEGAEIIDLGAESTRPGSERVSREEELRRLLPALRLIRKELPDVWLSVDTYKSEVARIALEEGADIINDVSGGSFDPKMFEVVSRYRCPYVLNHMKGRPETWKTEPPSYGDVIEEIVSYFRERIEKLKELGYEEEKLILDPGIGFGKRPEDNVDILSRFSELKILGKVLMVGVSRKSFIGEILEVFLGRKTEPRERLFGSLGALAPAVMGGAHIVRVHDVKETREFLAVLDAIRTNDAV
ncbi:MAG: dihydropteroate synthase [Aquificae bacterium]|nr:dihydropteroate synthase [Aquificota bacterium]